MGTSPSGGAKVSEWRVQNDIDYYNMYVNRDYGTI